MNPLDPQRPLSRRAFLRTARLAGLGAFGALLAPRWLAGCAGPAPSSAPAAVGAAGAWATGGTAAMKAVYPDPFLTQAAGEACVVTPAMTLGPCHAASPTRKDVSEGLAGLPVRLALRVVKAGSCEPVANAGVEIWHTNPAGVYSAFARGSMCNPSDADAGSKAFCRGVQVSDANGRVDFDTVFPGWYPGRTIHIHVTVRVDGKEYVTSQLFFEDAFTDAILASHPDYRGRPARTTTNANDGIARGGGANTVVSTQQLADGVLMAWKTIAIEA